MATPHGLPSRRADRGFEPVWRPHLSSEPLETEGFGVRQQYPTVFSDCAQLLVSYGAIPYRPKFLRYYREAELLHILQSLSGFCKTRNQFYVPGIIREHGPPDFARPTQVPAVIQRMSAMSSPFVTRFEVGEEEVALALEPST